MSGGATAIIGGALRPLLQEILRVRLGGADLRAADRLCGRLGRNGLACTSGYWNDAEDTPQDVLRACLQTLRMLARRSEDGYLSVKFPALGAEAGLIDTLFRASADLGVRLHADALAPDTTDTIHEILQRALEVPTGGAPDLGVTLPGRWPRSVEDARWACEQGLRVRVVKGEWADPEAPDHEARAGCLAVIDALAGKARHVSVASHDPEVVGPAVARLRATGTSQDVEQLYGLPGRACRAIAYRAGVGVRVYVPWGQAVLPHAVEFTLARRKRLPLWFLRDALVP